MQCRPICASCCVDGPGEHPPSCYMFVPRLMPALVVRLDLHLHRLLTYKDASHLVCKANLDC